MTEDVPTTANATFCATLVDEWIRCGVRHAYIAPGSRSTPLALALTERAELTIEVMHDERTASFAALGHGVAAGQPAVVLCSSGTAGAHFHAAVIEADLSAVPMLVCTADRPPELWGRGAPQVINQTELFGDIVRLFVEPGPPDDTDASTWRPLAATAYRSTVDTRPGPTHLNLSFRDPLTGQAGPLPPVVEHAEPAAPTSNDDPFDRITELIEAATTGVIVSGRGSSDPAEVHELAERLGWPVLADHRSGCRRAGTVRHFDALLRCADFADQQRPEVIIRLGEIVSSKSTSQWISAAAEAGASVIATEPWGRYVDPEQVATFTIGDVGFVSGLLEHVQPVGSDRGAEAWWAADSIAQATVDERLAAEPLSEPAISRTVLAAVPSGGALVVASSMPVRDIEWFGGDRDDITVISNRGANGIDGTIATAIGVAGGGTATVCLVGDVAFLHDSSSLVALAARTIDLTIVVIDNDGGGIFSFLPQHALLDGSRYEQLFGTPHGTDLRALVAAHGIRVDEWTANSTPDLVPAGVRVVRVSSDREANRELHDRLVDAVAKAITS